MCDTINIRGKKTVCDSNYRYKMSKLKIKIEGSGNGIKTVLVNVNDIESELYRDKYELCKYLSIVCNTNYDNNVLNGRFDTAYLQDKIFDYIEEYVLCSMCKLPETKYKISKKTIYSKCQACSYKCEIVGNEKLNKFIIKNKMILKQKALTKQKKEKSSKKVKNKEEIIDSFDSSINIDDKDIVWFSDLSEEAVKQRREQFFN